MATLTLRLTPSRPRKSAMGPGSFRLVAEAVRRNEDLVYHRSGLWCFMERYRESGPITNIELIRTTLVVRAARRGWFKMRVYKTTGRFGGERAVLNRTIPQVVLRLASYGFVLAEPLAPILGDRLFDLEVMADAVEEGRADFWVPEWLTMTKTVGCVGLTCA